MGRCNSYGRGIARKAAFTRKCSCGNPMWSRNHIEVNGNTEEITYVLGCANCKAYWATKSPSARKYWEKDMDRVPSLWQGFSYSGSKTVRELFREQDMKRLDYLEMIAACRDRDVLEAQKEAEKAHKAVEKFKAEMELHNGEM